jgi:HlyD family secretion protein
MIQKIKTFILAYKIIIGIVLVGLVVGLYFIFKNSTSGATSYITEVVKTGDITTTVSGTGQVEASNTIDLKPKNTGDITYVGVKAGDVVKRGRLIVSVDSRDAKIALENAKISLAKLTKEPDPLTLLQKKNALTESYDSGWNNVSSYVTDITLIMNDLENTYNGDGYLSYKNIMGLNSFGRTKISQGETSLYNAKKSLEELNKIYKTLSRESSQEEILNLINKSYESAKLVANAIKNTESAFNYMVDDLEINNDSNTITMRSNITSWLDSSNGYVNSLLSSVNNIKESSLSLSDTISGSDELDIRSAELSLQSKLDAYNDCFVYAPFDGIIATLSARVGVSSGASIGTLITKQNIIKIPLNEVDIASVKLGQIATLSFDAIDGLSIKGTVVEIDSVGTVSSGVVTYNVKVAFDSVDERIKPGMSASVEIITNQKQNILTVSSSSIKSKNGNSYIEMLENSSVVKKNVQTGISDDTKTEIISGLIEGDKIISKTITGTTTSTTKAPSIINAVGGNKTGGALRGAVIHND